MRIAALHRSSLLLAPAIAHVHLHHAFHGSPIGYAGLAAAAAASWVGVPGPGEPVLIAAGLLAVRHRLDIASVVLVAFAAAAAGGTVGWIIGMKAGRRLLSAPGPLHRLRLRALERGDEVFKRYVAIAVIVTPSWVAGIHRVRPAVYLPLNVLGAVVWAAGIGLGAYFAGPPIEDAVADVGWVITVGIVLLVLVAVWFEVRRRLRRKGTTPPGGPDGATRKIVPPPGG